VLWVRRIFEMIADGHSIYEVAQYLRKTGAPPPGGVSGKWHRATIRNIILSDTYLGTFCWGKEKRTTTTVSVVENGVRHHPTGRQGLINAPFAGTICSTNFLKLLLFEHGREAHSPECVEVVF
jgi:hypothetical protein